MMDRDPLWEDRRDEPPASVEDLRRGMVALFLRLERGRRDTELLLERERLLLTGEIAKQTELVEIGSAALVVMLLHALGVASLWWLALVVALGAWRHWHWGAQAKLRLRRLRAIEADLQAAPDAGAVGR